MRRTRFMSWLFLVLSLAFFMVRDFRFALEAPLANYWWNTQFSWAAIEKGPAKPSRLENLYTLKRYASTQKLLTLAEEAARRGDNKFVAFAALNLPVKEAKADAMRLADKAVRGDRELTWIYYPLACSLGSAEGWPNLERMTQHYIRLRIDKLQAFDPDNAVPHLLRADLIRGGRGKDWPDDAHYENRSVDPGFLGALYNETEWRKEMETAFASPRYDSYRVRWFDLYRHVLRERGWDHPAVVATLLESMPVPNLFSIRNYVNLLVLKLGADAEAAGQLDNALSYYWQAARFGNRMRLQAPSLIEWLVAEACQLIAYQRLAPALRKAGREREAQMVEDMLKQYRGEMWRYRGPLEHAHNYSWSVLLVNISAGLVWVFSLLTLVSLLYVNAKQWIRKGKKGRLFEGLTVAENYLPILLFLSCLGLYSSFVPFGHNFAYYMSTGESITDIPGNLTGHMYPGWQFYWSQLDLGLPNPFQDYIPYALSGIVLLTGVMTFPRLRRTAREGAPQEDARSLRRRRVNAVIYALLVAAGVLALATPWPWEKSLLVVGAVGLLLWGVLRVTSSYAQQARDPGANVRRARMLEAGAYLLLLTAAVAVGSNGLGVPARLGVPDFLLLPLSVPLLVGGVAGAIRMRLRLLTPFLFVLATFAVLPLSDYLRSKPPKPTPKAPLGVYDFLVPVAEGKPQEQLAKQATEQGVVFPPRGEYLGVLREAGAGEDLLKALHAAKGRWSEPALPEAQARSKAETDLRAAIKVNPNGPNLHFGLGFVLERQGLMEAAAHLEYGEALRLNPNFAGAHRGLGEVFLAEAPEAGHSYLKDQAAGIAELGQAVRLDPQDALAHYQLGSALLEAPKDVIGAGDVNGAGVELRQAVRLEPDDDLAHQELGRALLREHDVNGAVAEYREAVRLEPRIPGHHLGLGDALHEKGNRDGARSEYREAADLYEQYTTDQTHNLFGVAMRLEANGDLDVAIEEYRSLAGRAREGGAAFHDLAGKLLVKKGDLDGAIAEFHEAMRLEPRHAEPVVDLGHALEKMGSLPAALAEYRAALKLDPGNDDARAGFERLSRHLNQKQ